jgi:PD-(D/E)XK nuclease superfamily
MVKLKAIKALHSVHVAQCFSYLRAIGIQFCLSLNLGSSTSISSSLADDL